MAFALCHNHREHSGYSKEDGNHQKRIGHVFFKFIRFPLCQSYLDPFLPSPLPGSDDPHTLSLIRTAINSI